VIEEPGKEEIRQEKVDQILHAVREASGGGGSVLGQEPEVVQSCYLPCTPDNIPMMGKIGSMDGCYVAAGHGCWGILMGPATGEAMAHLILTGKSSRYVDLAQFRPECFGSKIM
jgi:glycine/D-amino acid oxidase-like deaminating enzyme